MHEVHPPSEKVSTDNVVWLLGTSPEINNGEDKIVKDEGDI